MAGKVSCLELHGIPWYRLYTIYQDDPISILANVTKYFEEPLKKITAVVPFSRQPEFERVLQPFLDSPVIEKVLVIGNEPFLSSWPKCDVIKADSLTSGWTWNAILRRIRTEYLLVVNERHNTFMAPGGLERFLDVAESTHAGLVFSDYSEGGKAYLKEHPVNDIRREASVKILISGLLCFFP